MKYLQLAILFIFLHILFSSKVIAQSVEPKADTFYQSLKVGDKVPDITFTNLINFHDKTARLSDFKGKLLILDFWNSKCSPCIASWPKLLELQKEYHEEIQIVLVNPLEESDVVSKFIDWRKKRVNVDMTLPSFCKGSKIEELFPVYSYPQVVWIDENGIVKSISDGSSINSANIRALLNDELVTMEQRIVEKKKSAVYEKPLYFNGNGGDGRHMMWYSMVSRYNDDLLPAIGLFANDSVGYFITIVNHPIRGLISFLFNESTNYMDRLPLNRLVLEVNDSTRFLSMVNGIYQTQNLYSYQLFSKEPTTKAKLKKMMKTDLERYFHINLNWEKRKMECLVLTAADTSVISYKEGKEEMYITDSRVALNNVKLDHFINVLRNHHYYDSPFPIINETGYKGNVGRISLDVNVKDFKALDKALEKYKMGMKREERMVNLMVVTEPDDYHFSKRELSEDERIANSRLNHALRLRRLKSVNDLSEYAKEVILLVNDYYMDNWEELNKYAWDFYVKIPISDKNSIDEAIKWVKRSIELYSNYYNNDTYASLLYKKGLKTKALKAARKALELADNAGVDATSTVVLIEKINSLNENE